MQAQAERERQARVILGDSERQIAEKFEVALSTVRRWSEGVARPHPRIQALVLNFLGS